MGPVGSEGLWGLGGGGGAVWPGGLCGLGACGSWGPVGDHTAHNVPQMLHENKLPGLLQHSKQLQLVLGDLVGLWGLRWACGA